MLLGDRQRGRAIGRIGEDAVREIVAQDRGAADDGEIATGIDDGGRIRAAHDLARGAEAESEAVDASPGARARPGPGGDLRRAGSGHMLLRSAEYYLQTLSPKLALLWLRQGLTGAGVDDLATLSLFFRLFSFLF